MSGVVGLHADPVVADGDDEVYLVAGLGDSGQLLRHLDHPLVGGELNCIGEEVQQDLLETSDVERERVAGWDVAFLFKYYFNFLLFDGHAHKLDDFINDILNNVLLI